ncbi:FHA domain-containing protein [Arthrobacter sp. H20]|uniref:FHA domain-containing protein n=1 Tax=Arthrobacter sp. H20 TaxID=1267981 RepID=UPI0004B23981|nr:FHA domain-containing protein [Arthrobacter sp. H20]
MNDDGGRIRVRLFILGQGAERTRSVEFSGDQLLIGRSSVCDVVLAEPDVSRKHAVVRRDGNRIYLRDLGSTLGTRINGDTVTGTRLLRDGDVLPFWSARLELASDVEGHREDTLPVRREPTAAGVRYDIADQRAGSISNVGGNQHNSYVTQILQERRSVLLDVAAARTKARWIMVTGFLFTATGFGFFAAGILRFLLQMGQSIGDGAAPDATVTPFGFEIFGVPSGLIGWSVAALGAILIVIGLILHVMAVARRKRVDRELPLPAGNRVREDME